MIEGAGRGRKVGLGLTMKDERGKVDPGWLSSSHLLNSRNPSFSYISVHSTYLGASIAKSILQTLESFHATT